MNSAAHHVTAVELEQALPEVLASPPDEGRLTAIFVRPATNERRPLAAACLSPESGIDGDRWGTESRLKGGKSDPRCQVSLMNVRFLRQIAREDNAMCLAGDNLIVDLDLSETNLPVGSQLAIGNEVILELTDLSHTGCSKLERRYGEQARAFMNATRRKALHLRGRYARILSGGTIRVDDPVRKRNS
jgi:MOSC domain-containing protein YiiM